MKPKEVLAKIQDRGWPLKATAKEEAIIATSAKCSKLYAQKFLDARFPLGEPAILKSASESYLYAKDVIHGRFKEAEDIIGQDAHYSFEYATKVLNGRFSKGEKAMAQHAGYAADYAVLTNIIFEEAEDVIAQDCEASFTYAANALHGRFEKGEDAISKDAGYSYQYATYVMEGRFEKGEDAISTNAQYCGDYAQYILKDRFEKGEDTIIQDLGVAINYSTHVLKGRWDRLENILINSESDDKNEFIIDYAKNITELGIKIPEEIHNRLICLGITNSDDCNIKEYFESIKDLENNRKLELVSHLTVEELQVIIKRFNKTGVES